MNIEIKITDTENVEFPIIIKNKRGNIIYKQYENGGWYKYTYDKNGNELTFKDSNGDWYEGTYNENGNELTFKNSDDFWRESTYDDKGKELTCKNSLGYYRIKGKYVTKEEFEVFVNGTPEYTMEELVSKLGHNFKIKK
jgi:hypothetical protein